MKRIIAIILITSFCSLACNPTLTTKLYPSPLPNLNQAIKKHIGLFEFTTADQSIPSSHCDLLKKSLAATFSEKNFLVYDVQAASDENWNKSALIIRAVVEETHSQSPDGIDWLPIGLGFVVFVIPGYLGYRHDSKIERRATKVSVKIDMIDPTTSQAIWSNTITAERGDEKETSVDVIYEELYDNLAGVVVTAIESKY